MPTINTNRYCLASTATLGSIICIHQCTDTCIFTDSAIRRRIECEEVHVLYEPVIFLILSVYLYCSNCIPAFWWIFITCDTVQKHGTSDSECAYTAVTDMSTVQIQIRTYVPKQLRVQNIRFRTVPLSVFRSETWSGSEPLQFRIRMNDFLV